MFALLPASARRSWFSIKHVTSVFLYLKRFALFSRTRQSMISHIARTSTHSQEKVSLNLIILLEKGYRETHHLFGLLQGLP